VESWHAKLNRRLAKEHPNILILLELLQQEQAENETSMPFLEVGKKPRAKKLKYGHVDEGISNLKSRFRSGHIDLIYYVDTVSYYLHLED